MQVTRNETGLTLLELLIAMTVGVIAMGLAYGTYSAQQRAYTNEQLVIDMQQNARSAMAFMRREIRMAGYNPRALNGIDDDSNGSIDEAGEGVVDGFTVIRGDRTSFSSDSNGDGDDLDDNESITYRFKIENDANQDGVADTGVADLFRYHRKGSTDCSVLAFDIQAIAFAYAFDSDGDGQLDTFPDNPDLVIWAWDSSGAGNLDRYLDTNKDGVIDAADAANGAALSPQVPMAAVRAAQVWLLARTSYPIPRHTENETYVVGPKRITPGDSYKRTLLNGIAMVRNLRN